nr:Gag-Pol polyprotein [Tanacetum cinerariifolium]
MASDHVSSNPAPQCPTTTIKHDSLSPDPQSQENVPHVAKTVTTSNKLDLLFSLMFDELVNGTTPVVSKSSDVHAANDPNIRQQHTTNQSSTTTVAADTPPLNIQSTSKTTCQESTQAPTITNTENINEAERLPKMHKLKMTNYQHLLCTDTRMRGDIVSSYHPLEQVIGNPSQSIRTRHQLETDGEICMFALIVSQTEPKNIKEAMADSTRIEAM